MDVNLSDSFEVAMETGELVTIKYHGGSSPGTVREIMPVKIENDRVRARCYTSDAVKSFMFNKIELISKPIHQLDEADVWDGRSRGEEEFFEIPEKAADICTDKHEALKSIGWMISFYENGRDEFALCLHRPKKMAWVG